MADIETAALLEISLPPEFPQYTKKWMTSLEKTPEWQTNIPFTIKVKMLFTNFAQVYR